MEQPDQLAGTVRLDHNQWRGCLCSSACDHIFFGQSIEPQSVREDNAIVDSLDNRGIMSEKRAACVLRVIQGSIRRPIRGQLGCIKGIFGAKQGRIRGQVEANLGQLGAIRGAIRGN